MSIALVVLASCAPAPPAAEDARSARCDPAQALGELRVHGNESMPRWCRRVGAATSSGPGWTPMLEKVACSARALGANAIKPVAMSWDDSRGSVEAQLEFFDCE